MSVKGAQMLCVAPFSPQHKAAVVKGLEGTQLGLSPREDGAEVLVPMPRMTMDQMKELVKLAKGHAETCKRTLAKCVLSWASHSTGRW